MDKDISKKRDRTTTQRIHIRNEVVYRMPNEIVGGNPYYQSSPTLASGVYGKHRFRAVMAYGTTPYAYVELDKDKLPNITKVLGTVKRGVASVTNSVKGVGTTHNHPDRIWVGWAYNSERDFNPVLPEQTNAIEWTTEAIVEDIKRVIDALNKKKK